MKKTYLSLRKIATMFLIAGLTIGASGSVFANKGKTEILNTPDVHSSVSFAGFDNGNAAYIVKVDAASAVNFEIVIKDRAGMVLFSQVFEAASFSKKFRITEEDANSYDLTFSVKGLPNGAVNTFKVSTEETAVTEVAVVKEK